MVQNVRLDAPEVCAWCRVIIRPCEEAEMRENDVLHAECAREIVERAERIGIPAGEAHPA